MRLLDGRLVLCKFRPLTGGATLITFQARSLTGTAPLLEEIAPSRRLA